MQARCVRSQRCALEAGCLVGKILDGRKCELALPRHTQQTAGSDDAYMIVGKALFRQGVQIFAIGPIRRGEGLGTIERRA